jgi:hypothetical protein
MKLSEYDKVTKGSGVYLLYNEATSTMKVGMSKCVHQRLQGYSKLLLPWGINPDVFVFYCSNARDIEKELIAFMGAWDKVGGKEYFHCDSLNEVLKGIADIVTNNLCTHIDIDQERLSLVENAVLSTLFDAQKKGLHLFLTEISDKVNVSLSTTKRCIHRLLVKGKIKKEYKHIRGFCKQAVYKLL